MAQTQALVEGTVGAIACSTNLPLKVSPGREQSNSVIFQMGLTFYIKVDQSSIRMDGGESHGVLENAPHCFQNGDMYLPAAKGITKLIALFLYTDFSWL